MMLLSNWDNKDVRDVARGSNTAIFEHRIGKRRREARYLIIDWGAALGAWGGNILQPWAMECRGVRRTTDLSSSPAWSGDVVRVGLPGAKRTADHRPRASRARMSVVLTAADCAHAGPCGAQLAAVVAAGIGRHTA